MAESLAEFISSSELCCPRLLLATVQPGCPPGHCGSGCDAGPCPVPVSSLPRRDPVMGIRREFVFRLTSSQQVSGLWLPQAGLWRYLCAVVSPFSHVSGVSVGQRDDGEWEPSGPRPRRESTGGVGVSPSHRRGERAPLHWP